MSGTDPKGKWFGKGDPTQAFKPEGSGPVEQPEGLPKIPGITLQYEIARGGMGVVYAGRQDFLDRRVAVKFLSVELGGQSFVQRFQREAKILAGIKHPNIVACHTADTTEDGQSYLVMEFIDGPSLKAWIQDNGPVSPMASLRLVRASAQALAHAHQSDIIHRDVKPENILLETLTSTSIDVAFPFTPKLVDLGLARMTHESVGMGLTSPGSVMGTPSTMSPEQFDDPDSVDFRSDIYGLGCCLYEMLTGHPAFRGTKLTDIVTKKREAVGPNPCGENADLPASVGALCQRMLASDRNDRPASYKELDKLLEEMMMALVTSRQRTDTIVDMPKGDDDGGATMVSAPRPGGIAPKQPDPFEKGPAKGEPTKPDGGGNTAPGMLNTGEFAFLAAGGGDDGGSGPKPPQFDDGSSDTRPTNVSTGEAPPNKTGLYIGIGAAALLAAAVGVWMGTRGDEGAGGGGGQQVVEGGNGTRSGANTLPVVATEGPRRVDVDETFTVRAKASDADGDALRYRWVVPTGVIMIRDNQAEAQFLLRDGLPGMRFDVAVDVLDGAGTAVRGTQEIEVGECVTTAPFLTGSRDWSSEGSWFPVQDVEPAVAGRVRKVDDDDVLAVKSANVGDDAFWEYLGTITPTEQMGADESRAVLGILFGEVGYGVRSVLKGERDFLIEVVERVPGQSLWRPVSPPVVHEWTRPEETNNDNRTWFSIRREDKQLVIEIGEYVQPPAMRGEDLPPASRQLEPKKVFELSGENADQLARDGKVLLAVEKGRAIVRLEQR